MDIVFIQVGVAYDYVSPGSFAQLGRVAIYSD